MMRSQDSNEYSYCDHYFIPHYYNTVFGNFNYSNKDNKTEKIFKNFQMKEVKTMLDKNVEELRKGRFEKETESF